ncbi:MAG: ATP-dependent sacrificial sulfur transferase LarE [Actinomycetaceae bacterium]|nr:ATP-dependent sacrificial sulfur transferase LarE [Actinomycetaceae bacterium]
MTVDLWAPLPPELEDAAGRVAEEIRRAAKQPDNGQVRSALRVGVAYSGGVDSSVLAALTARAVGADSTVLLLAVSPSLATRARHLAIEQAQLMGLPLREVTTREVEDPQYQENTHLRCYHCKSELFDRISSEVTTQEKLDLVVVGTNASDLRAPDRPGQLSAAERGVLSPLASAGVTKAQVRALAAALGLPSASLPASPCLASRIPHGTPVNAEILHAIDQAEEVLVSEGFSTCRLRHHGEIARIEVPIEDLPRFADESVRERVIRGVRAAGFRYVTVDLAGLQSGAFTLQVLNQRQEVG